MTGDIRLRNGDAVADIALRGAELKRWSVGPVPLIWTPVADIWPDTAPILFPVVGWTRGSRVLVDGEAYPLGLHGFARQMPFLVESQGRDHATFLLKDSQESRAQYPFSFALAVTYRLEPTALRTELSIRNWGPHSMPYACGLHPGFSWPFAGGACEDYTITFEDFEAPTVPVISADGLFTPMARPVPIVDRRLGLSATLFAREALCFLNARSRSVHFSHKQGAAITVALEHFPHIALWSRPKGRFLSIEAWTGHGDQTDSDGDLRTKPSMITLAPGEEGHHAATYIFLV